MYKKKFFYWPILCLVIFGFMFYTKGMKSTHIDGPYISREGNKVRFTYVGYDTLQIFEQDVDPGMEKSTLNGLLSDENRQYYINDSYQPETTSSYTAPKALYLGNIYGDYDGLVEFLKAHGIVNENGNWAWGKGHLVFTGNVFGYGADVVRCLWLIAQLEQEAASAGGKVHMLLGDQEVKNLSGNIGTLNPGLYRLYKKMDIEYSGFYAPSTIQGKWLRSKNSIIKINNNLVAHGGISPEIVSYKLDLKTINTAIREQLTAQAPEQDSIAQLVMSSKGPLKYSSYIKDGEENLQLMENHVDSVLSYYDASSMIIATTGAKAVYSTFGNKIYAIDLPMDKTDVTLEGLLQEEDSFYRITSAGEKIKI